MKAVNEYLKQLGLSEIEAKLYLGLLELGSTTVMELANHVNIKRITAHFNIESLISKGLITETRKGARRQIVAENPEKLQNILEDRESEVLQLKQSMPIIIQSIAKAIPKQKTSQDVDIRFYEGKKGVRTIYEEVLSSKEVRSYVNLDMVAAIFPENVDLFNSAMQNNPDLVIREIVEQSETAKKNTSTFINNNTGKYNYKFAPTSLKLSAADVMIYDGKVAVVSVSEDSNGIIFVNENFYNISKEVFDFVWRMIEDAEKMKKDLLK